MAPHLINIMILVVSLLPMAAQAQFTAVWKGGEGKWSEPSNWTCQKESGLEECVPNGLQYAVQVDDNGKVNVDIDVSVNEVVSSGTGALSISGHSLNAKLISGLASVELENGAAIRTDLGLLITGGGLTMQDSSISGGVASVINPAAPSTGSLRASGSSIQQLALRGSMRLSNSTVGATAGFSGSTVGAAAGFSGAIIESSSSSTNSRFTGGLLVDNGGSLTLSSSQLTVPGGANLNLIIGSSGAGSVQADNGSQITVAEGVLTQIGAGPSGAGTLTLDEATFTSNDRVSVGDGGTGRLVLRNGGTLSAGLPAASLPVSAFLLENNSTVSFDVSPNTLIDVRGRATLLGKMEFQQAQSFASGAFLPVLRASETNIPTIPGQPTPYLRLASSNPQLFTAIDMAGNSIGHLSFVLPNNPTTEPVLVPTVCRGSRRGCVQGEGTVIGVVATNGAPHIKASFSESRPTNGIESGTPHPCTGGVTNEFSIIASATTQSDKPITMGVAAAALGYDHFNFIQAFKIDTEVGGLRMLEGDKAPPLPYYDPPPGGWKPTDDNDTSNGVADLWPFYYDEFYAKHVPSPTEPQYINFYVVGDEISDVGGGDSPDASFGFVFSDRPCRGLHSKVEADTQLVGVKGTGCNNPGVSTSNCSWQPIRETGWHWSISDATLKKEAIP